MKYPVLLPALLAIAPFADSASELPLVPDVRRAAMTGDTLPALWTPAQEGGAGFAPELAPLARPDASRQIPLRLAVDPAAVTAPEGYRLEIRKNAITLTGADAAGVFYGLKTLRQLVALHPRGCRASSSRTRPHSGCAGTWTTRAGISCPWP